MNLMQMLPQLVQMLPQFIQGAKRQYGNNFDPQQTVQNMLGQNCNSQQEALQLMLKAGKINEQQYGMLLKML